MEEIKHNIYWSVWDSLLRDSANDAVNHSHAKHPLLFSLWGNEKSQSIPINSSLFYPWQMTLSGTFANSCPISGEVYAQKISVFKTISFVTSVLSDCVPPVACDDCGSSKIRCAWLILIIFHSLICLNAWKNLLWTILVSAIPSLCSLLWAWLLNTLLPHVTKSKRLTAQLAECRCLHDYLSTETCFRNSRSSPSVHSHRYEVCSFVKISNK